MFPALAVAAELRGRGRAVVLLTDRRGARYAGHDLDVHLLRAASPSGGIAALLRGTGELLAGLVQSLGLWRRLRPAAVAAFGGYACVPPALAAALRGTPLLVHEQNAVFGRANRLIARFAAVLALSFEPTAAVPEKARATRLTGNPVRPGFDAAASHQPADALRLLVLGGSQGARIMSDVVPVAVGRLDDPIRRELRVAQQCRPEDLERVRTIYAASGITAELATFFEDVPRRMAEADLVIARAGASTVSELLALGRPSLLVPFPHAADDHQRANAQALERAGAAVCVPQERFDAERLAAELMRLHRDRAALAAMAAAAVRLAQPDAAARIADLLTDLASEHRA
jgi:UDP-N-acetylglucosamine--N-acetylmuramyl-(pentapeptide) pyrophosphoryl-undecaprenol N-acetylglucosamine transferase